MDEQLKSLKNPINQKEFEKVHFTDQNKQAVRQKLNKSIKSGKFIPNLVLSLLLIILGSSAYMFFTNSSEHSLSPQIITDTYTSSKVPEVEGTNGIISIEWLSDSMDRGNHEYDTSAHGLLVVDSTIGDLGRGQVVYYNTPNVLEKNIGRIVGLPGETVEIKKARYISMA